MRALFFGLVVVGVLASSGSNASDSACDRACLKGFIDQYLTALVAHDPSRLPLADHVRFTEDTRDLKLGDGLWKDVTGLGTFRQDILDVRTGIAGAYVVAMENDKPVLFVLRLKVAGGKITEIETVVTRNKEEGYFMETDALTSASPAMTYVPKPNERETRDKAIELASYYPRGLEAGSFVKVDAPFAEDAYRTENGLLTAGPGCTMRDGCKNIKTQPSPTRPGLKSRLVAVDEKMGIVWYRIDWPRGPGMRLAAWEEFKVYGGQIHAVQAFMESVPENERSGWE
jgi:hypothetical protein